MFPIPLIPAVDGSVAGTPSGEPTRTGPRVRDPVPGGRRPSDRPGPWARPGGSAGSTLLGTSIGQRIALAYAAAPVVDPCALPAYRRLREELRRQFDVLTRPRPRRGLGIQVEVWARDPYLHAAEMTADLRDNGRIRVYSTAACGNHHPFFSDEENDQFRAVHDVFGHALTGSAFDCAGEEAAWRAHRRLLSPLAGVALATETLGQTSARIWSDAPNRFPAQKMVLLPPYDPLPPYYPLPPYGPRNTGETAFRRG
jgi:hypothetical protein